MGPYDDEEEVEEKRIEWIDAVDRDEDEPKDYRPEPVEWWDD